MAYQNNGYNNNRGRNNGYNSNRYNQQNNNREEIKPEKISKPLHEEYSDATKIFLEDGVAYKKAKELSKVPPHQLRKILDEVKKATASVKADPNQFGKARDNLYYIIPLMAYNAGRMPALKPLYEFVYTHINEQSIQSCEDIVTLDKLVTSIVAYHKFFSK